MSPSPQPLSREGERGFFGAAAARLCHAACLSLGWRPNEFWEATPAELALTVQEAADVDVPNKALIDELRRRFPDETRD